ncbi:MAG: OsmC family protein [Capsulimonas sp.]|jgi:osmotically inducible protein OsmC|uniref:OsmC family protein n=1 Tax=Capsulimonas sp. TaxID=2494211 RepID=UPI003267F238
MATRKADAEWTGDLKDGAGTMELGSGAFKGAYSFKSRMEEGVGTNPEELIGAAHAGCFSMQFAAMLAAGGHVATRIHTTAQVHFGPVDGGFAITSIDLATEGEVPGLSAEEFQSTAEAAKTNCPVSKALAATPITLKATLL